MSNQSSNLFGEFIKMLSDNWYNFVVNSNQSYMKLTADTYDFLCKLFCDLMKPMALNIARNHARDLEEQRKRELLYIDQGY